MLEVKALKDDETSSPLGGAQDGLESNFGHWLIKSKEQLILAVLTGLPMLFLNQILDWVSDQTTSEPWQVLWLLMPMALIAHLLWRVVKRRGALRLHLPFIFFFCAYILLFSVAAGSRFLDWKQTLIGFEDSVPRNWLSLNWAGDWRYNVLPRKSRPTDMLVVTVEPAQTKSLQEGRMQIVRLIKLAAKNGARGIAFDFYLTKTSALDPLICHTVAQAGIPVFIGYTFDRHEDDISARPNTKSLENCLPMETSQGHLLGYIEADNRVRSIPLFFKGQPDRPALSVRIAQAMEGDKLEIPPLLYFIAPEKKFIEIKYDELEEENARKRLRDNFVIVGERSKRDMFDTPFGTVPGVMIHANAAYSLRSGHFIKRPPEWMSFILVFGLCFMISILAAENRPPKRLLIITITASAAILAIASASIFIWQVWLAIIYPLVAMWLLLGLFLLFRRRLSSR